MLKSPFGGLFCCFVLTRVRHPGVVQALAAHGTTEELSGQYGQDPSFTTLGKRNFLLYTPWN